VFLGGNSMEKMILDSEKLLMMERRIMDKLLTAEEDRNLEMFNILSTYFSGLRRNTDTSIQKLMSKYPAKMLLDFLKAKVDPEKEESFVHLTLAEHIDFTYINSISEKLYNVNSDCFLEEHLRQLYIVYIWYIQNHDLNEEFKKSLHKFMVIRLVNSGFARNYFSGDIEKANRLSDPDQVLGFFEARDISLKTYYSNLNKLVDDSNICEMFEGLAEPQTVAARRKMIELELVALCAQMEHRQIAFPFLDSPINDYSEDVLRKADDIYKEFSEGKSKKKVKKPIYL
jgi:hypothetical protein